MLSQADQIAIANAQAAYPNLPPGLLAAVQQQETGGSTNPDTAVSSSGAVGLFQVLPSTAANPGYGVPPLVNSTDPNQSAMFAAAYLTAQQQKTGSWAGAVNAYSGGSYQLSNLQGFSGDVAGSSTLPMLDQNGNPVQSTDPITAASGLGVAGQAAGSATAQAASSLLDPLWEIISRAGLMAAGLALCLIAIAALLWQSKTVQVSARALAA